ncbi:protein of unknown function [Candidatus Filomicrobium marinum]|uniref:Uncharacterized protein n=1 Tax=Candidatus Filomicrobium marinum TaxID=1608628 RepID=A0A0D6JJ89_9HYPH|nr:hypothetical protein [Candidatus Filomicrobium marinum]CFX35956.1 protein of unknown function [Candidatus Filomicrobium marinum]CPR21777.1 protein of unknown function [Candidatus Filomicrobium marinum]
MGERLKIDREAAKAEPESQFQTPDDLVASEGLTRGEKIAALKRWAFLVNRRLASGDEGMPVSGAQEAADAELLRKIESSRSALIAGDVPEEET